MESNFYIFEGNMILLSILIFVSLFFISLFTSIYFQKRFNLQRIKTPLVTISILVSVRIIFELNKIEWNKNKINPYIYIYNVFCNKIIRIYNFGCVCKKIKICCT